MFDFFRKRTAEDFVKEAKETFTVPTVEPIVPTVQNQVVYRIGKTEDGKVILSLGDQIATSVIMSNAGVDDLIRMLEAAKNPESDKE